MEPRAVSIMPCQLTLQRSLYRPHHDHLTDLLVIYGPKHLAKLAGRLCAGLQRRKFGMLQSYHFVLLENQNAHPVSSIKQVYVPHFCSVAATSSFVRYKLCKLC